METRYAMTAAVSVALLFGTLSAQTGTAPDAKVHENSAAAVQSFYDYSDMPDTESRVAMKTSINAALETHRMRMQQAPQDVADGLHYTVKAVHSLEKNKVSIAEKSLEAATALFHTALINDPGLDLVPVADDVSFEELTIAPQQVAEELERAKSALEEHRTQEARTLLMPLKDQMTVVTESVPMTAYPAATAAALKALRKGHKQEAIQTLRDGFTLLVIEKEVLPMPLLKARAYADAASRLKSSEKKQALAWIAKAKDEMEMAVLLGYTSAEDVDYKRSADQLSKLEKSIAGEQKSGSIFDALKRSFDTMLKKPGNGLHKVPFHATGRSAFHSGM